METSPQVLGEKVGKKIKDFPFKHFILMSVLFFLMVDDSITDILYSLDKTVKLCIFAFAYIAIYMATKLI